MRLFKKKYTDWVNVRITDDHMFCSVMEDEGCCKEFLKRVLGIEAVEIKYSTKQKWIRNRIRSKGVRLDVYVRDADGNSYNIEMQTTREKYIAKRTRYYHSEMDGYQLKKGQKYNQLGKNIVIFVCTYDPFGKNRSVYTMKTSCMEDSTVEYDDGMVSIFLNTVGDREGVDDKLANVLDYIKTGKSNDDYTKELDERVQEMNEDDDWRDKHMTFGMKLDQMFENGIERGQLLAVMKSVHDGDYLLERGAEILGITPKELAETMDNEGYTIYKK